MLEAVYDTLRSIIWSEIQPRDAYGNPVVWDAPIRKWMYGDRTLVEETPSVLFTGKTIDNKRITHGINELTHQIAISGWDRGSNAETSERRALELTRLLYASMLPHTTIWVMTPCAICLKKTLTPSHFYYAHGPGTSGANDVMSSEFAQATTNFNSLWAESHISSAPSWILSGLSAEAFDILYNNIITTGSHTGIADTSPFTAIQQTKMQPVRMLYEVIYSGINPVSVEKESEILKGGEFTITAKELVRIPAFGPDNVSTNAYTWKPIVG